MAHVHGLDDKGLRLLLVELVLEVVCVGWQHPRSGNEVEFIFEGLCHAGEVAGKIVFSGEGLHPWLRVDTLVRSKLADLLGLDSHIGPKQVPVRRIILVQLEVHLADYALYHVVAARVRAQDQLLIRLLLRCGLGWGGLSHVIVVFRPLSCILGVHDHVTIRVVIIRLCRPKGILDLLNALVGPHFKLT